jgi:hypothetical protein
MGHENSSIREVIDDFDRNLKFERKNMEGQLNEPENIAS